MTRTTVVNVKHEECDVYIGRAMPGRPGSPFANLARIGPSLSRTAAIAAYPEHLAALLEKDPGLWAQLQALRGKRLGCWCKPLACHGDVLVELLDGPPPEVVEPQGALF